MTQRIGIFSGSFDPVHAGHVAFALEALQSCSLDEVIFLPERLPRGKDDITDISERITWLTHRLANNPKLRVVEIASERFTVNQTLPELQRLFKDANLTLLIGSDVAHTMLYRWEGLGKLLSEVSLAIGIRQNDTPDNIAQIIRKLEADHNVAIKHTIIHTQHKHISSSQIRNGLSVRMVDV